MISQSKEGLKIQAEQQLQTMSPEEIDAAIKKYGLTREEADAKAKSLGIDLETFLKSKSASPSTTIVVAPSTTPTEIATPTEIVRAADEIKMSSQKIETEAIKSVKTDTNLFGQSFFKTPGTNFEPTPSIADKEYIVGAGDALKISLWGDIDFTTEAVVDKDGRINISTVGPIFVSGYTLEEAKNKIKIGMSKYYAGLVSSPPRIFFDLSISKLHPIRVFIMGEVEKPGGYLVNNFANVFNSLFVVGGPKESGSMRDVRVIRNGKIIANVDLYDYFIGTLKTKDLRVNDNDIIFVPLRGKTVTIVGPVLRVSKFELLPDENLRKLLEFAGGIKSNLYTDRLSIDRIIPFDERVKGEPERKLIDIDFSEVSKGKKDFTLEDGDYVKVFPILELKENYVEILGDVRRPGTYEIKNLKTVRDLVNIAEGPTPTTYFNRVELTRTLKNEKPVLITLDLEKILSNDSKHNIVLLPKDNLQIFSIYDINPKKNFTISGYAKNPGTYPFADSLTFKQILKTYVGIEDSVRFAQMYLKRVDIFRLNPDLTTKRIINLNLDEIIKGKIKDFPIQPEDEIKFYSLSDLYLFAEKVSILGNVKNPNTFELKKNMSLTDLILQAGGFTENASTLEAEIVRVFKNGGDKDSLVKIKFSKLPNLLDSKTTLSEIEKSEASNFVLNSYDIVFIRPNPYFELAKLVTINGEVNFPGEYALSTHGETITDLITRAGEIKKSGYTRGGNITRNGVKLRFNLEDAIDDTHEEEDIILLAGDMITIPMHTNTIIITGEINNPGVYAFVKDENRNFYINRAGGLADSADYALITYPEGFIMKSSLNWLFGSNPEIPDGSSIHITKEIPEPKKDKKEEDKEFQNFMREQMTYLTTILTLVILLKQTGL